MNKRHWQRTSLVVCAALLSTALASTSTNTASAATSVSAVKQPTAISEVSVHADSAVANTAAAAYARIDASQVQSINYKQSDLYMITLYGDRQEDKEKIEQLVAIYNRMVDDGSLAAMHEAEASAEPLSHFSTSTTITLRDGSNTGLTFNYVADSGIWEQWSSRFESPQSGQLSVQQAGIGEAFRIYGQDGWGDNPLQLFWIPKSPNSQNLSTIEGENGLYYPNKASLYIGEAPVKFDRYDAQFRIAPFGIDADGNWQAILPGEGELYVDSVSLGRSFPLTLKRSADPVIAVEHQLMPEDMQPIIRDDRTFVSVRAASELFGATVQWDAAAKRVDVVSPSGEANGANKNNAAQSAGDSISVWIDGKRLTTDVQPFIQHDRVYVPVRAIGEALGAEITYDEQVPLVHISHPKTP